METHSADEITFCWNFLLSAVFFASVHYSELLLGSMVLKTNACLSRSIQLYVNKIETSYLKFTYNVTYIGLGSELNSLVNFTAIRWSVFMNTSSLPFTIVSSIVSPFHNQKSFSYVMRAQFVPWFICIRKQNVGKQFIVAARMKMKKIIIQKLNVKALRWQLFALNENSLN